MTRAVAAALPAFLLLFSAAVAQAESRSCWSVLDYDEQGNVMVKRNCADQDLKKGSNGGGVQKQVEPNQLVITGMDKSKTHRLRELGYTILEKIWLNALQLEFLVVRVPEGQDLGKSMEQVRRELPGVVVDTNDILDLSAKKTSSGDLPFDRRTVGWGKVSASCGRGLKIGIIDGAVDLRVPALAGQRIKYRSFIKAGRKAAAHDHGTGLATLLVGRPGVSGSPGGLLPGAALYAANIFEIRSGKQKGNLAAMLRAIDWLADSKVPLINMSLAGRQNVIMKVVLNRLKRYGVITVASAGNFGPGAPPTWPAAHPNVIAVTAIDKRLGIYRWANRGDYIDFSAPGVNVHTLTTRGMEALSGTSIATPYITAIVGLHLLADFPPDMAKIRKSMKRYTKDLGKRGRDSTFGEGLVRLRPDC